MKKGGTSVGRGGRRDTRPILILEMVGGREGGREGWREGEGQIDLSLYLL